MVELSDNENGNSQVFTGKHAEFFGDKSASAKKAAENGDSDDDIDSDDVDKNVDPDTVLNHQQFDQVSTPKYSNQFFLIVSIILIRLLLTKVKF